MDDILGNSICLKYRLINSLKIINNEHNVTISNSEPSPSIYNEINELPSTTQYSDNASNIAVIKTIDTNNYTYNINNKNSIIYREYQVQTYYLNKISSSNPTIKTLKKNHSPSLLSR